MTDNENDESRFGAASSEGQPNMEPDQNTASEDASGGPNGVDEKIAALTAEVEKQKDAHLRALAEMENLRRRMSRDKEEAVRYASFGFARDLVTVADNLRRALQSVPDGEAKSDIVSTLLEGVGATERELLSVFEKHNVKKIDPVGEKFDHNFHQAMFELENTGKPAGTVVQVLQAGYVQHDRLLRPAMVGVAKGGTPGEAQPDKTRVDTSA